MKNLYLFLLLIVIPFFLIAQGANDDWTFHQQTGDGWFSSLDEDSNGNIIVGGGSPNSHFRIFDGSNWTLYHPDDFGLNIFFFGRDVAVDLNDNIWLSPGNQDGVTHWNGTTFDNYTTSNSDIISNSNFGVAVDQNNKLWTSSLQSFDGNVWESFSNNSCYEGGPRVVFVDDNNDVWISGVVSIGIETGDVSQPCVYRISNGLSTSYHLDDGDNLPELEGPVGNHLIGQFSDGTIFIVGKTANGIEIKTFSGTSWDDFHSFDSPEVGQSYWGLWVDENGNILLGGAKDNETAQIAKFCNGDWTFYDLPEADGFPSVIYDLMVDSQSRLWFAGNVGLGSVPYVPTTCQTTSTQDPDPTKFCSGVNYNQGQLTFLNCNEKEFNSLNFLLYNSVGQVLKNGKISDTPHFIGKLPAGLYFIHLKQNNQQIQTMKFFVN